MKEKTLSIIVPAYNEEKTILEVLKRVEKADTLKLKKEIIVVNDCSKDSTGKILQKVKSRYKVFNHEVNQGKGAAIRTGLQHATGDIILIQDADMEYDPKEYPKLLKPILDGETDVVYGSRLINMDIKNMYWLHYFGNKSLSLATTIIYGTKITDMETGYKVFKRKVVEGMQLKARRFDFEPEITAKIIRRGYKIKELPIDFEARSFEEGKKITWRDGVKALYYLLYYRFFN